MINLKTQTVYLLFMGLSIIGYGQDGTLDNSFGDNGILNLDLGTMYDDGSALAIQPDGKIIFGGTTTKLGEDKDFALTRINEDGSLDKSFGDSGVSTTNIGSGDSFIIEVTGADELNSIALQNDGKIISVGRGGSRIFNFAITCHNPDGSINTNFGNNGRVVTDIESGLETASSVAVQEDNKFLVAGGLNYNEPDVTDKGDFVIVRYNEEGSLDTSFGEDGIVLTDINNNSSDFIKVIKLLSDGKIIAAGYSGGSNGVATDFAIARYQVDGSLDNTFGVEGVTTIDLNDNYNLANDLAIQPDGKIVVVGYSKSSNITEFAIARLNNNGDLDSSFGIDGKQLVSFNSSQLNQANSVALQQDGKILVSGFSRQVHYNSFSMVRLNLDGEVDTTFGSDGKVVTDFNINSASNDMLIQSDNKILLAGTASSSNGYSADYYFGLARYIVDITIDVAEPNIKFNQISIFPNPVADYLSIEFYLKSKNQLSLYLTDNMGKVLKTYFSQQSHGSGLHKYNLELSDIDSGIYYLGLIDNNRPYIEKIIK